MTYFLSNTALPNLAITVFAIIGIYYCLHARIVNQWLSFNSREILVALAWMCAGVLFDSGYWFLGHAIHGPFVPDDTFFEQFKGVKSFLAAICWGWGVLTLIRVFEQWNGRTLLAVFSGVFFLAYIGSGGWW